MLIKVEWPNGSEVFYGENATSDKTWLEVSSKIVTLSHFYDVVIDNGVVTFVEKS